MTVGLAIGIACYRQLPALCVIYVARAFATDRLLRSEQALGGRQRRLVSRRISIKMPVARYGGRASLESWLRATVRGGHKASGRETNVWLHAATFSAPSINWTGIVP